MRMAPLLLAGTLLAIAPTYAQTPANAPPGWKSARNTLGATVFTPPDLKTGEVFEIAVFDSTALKGKSLDDWLTTFSASDGKELGQLTAPLKRKFTDGRVISGSGIYQTPEGKMLGVIYLGLTRDEGGNVHASRILFSPQGEVLSRYQEAMAQIGRALAARASREGAGKKAGGTTTPTIPTTRATRGGKLVPGVYVGSQYYGDELSKRFRVYLYPNGEYRVCDENDKDLRYNTGHYEYRPDSGKLEIDRSFDLTNSRIDPEDDFCYYGRDASGKPIIYAENDHGVSIVRTTLRYAGETKRPSPEAETVAKDRAEAEAKRYKYVTPPGKGVSPGQIAAIVHHYDVDLYSAGVNGLGTSVTDDAYLLLNDGTVHNGLPVPPDQLDVALSRRREPEKWGRWRRQRGKYLVSWAGGAYQELPGEVVRAAQSGQRLHGHWGAGSSSASLAGSSYRLWGVSFTRDGRFRKDNRGGASNGTFMQSGGQMAVNTQYDDNGSVTAATGENIAVIGKRKNNPNGDREGTYSIKGYTMTLRYDNGQVQRLPFFFTGPSQKTLWFEGNQLARSDEKD